MRKVGRGHLSRDFQAFAVESEGEREVERGGICVLWYS